MTDVGERQQDRTSSVSEALRRARDSWRCPDGTEHDIEQHDGPVLRWGGGEPTCEARLDACSRCGAIWPYVPTELTEAEGAEVRTS